MLWSYNDQFSYINSMFPCHQIIHSAAQEEVERACGGWSSQTKESGVPIAQNLDRGTELHLVCAAKYLFPHLSNCWHCLLMFPCVLSSSQLASESCWQGPPSRTTCRSCTPCWASFSPASLQLMRRTTLSTLTPMCKINLLLVGQTWSSYDKVWIIFSSRVDVCVYPYIQLAAFSKIRCDENISYLI